MCWAWAFSIESYFLLQEFSSLFDGHGLFSLCVFIRVVYHGLSGQHTGPSV